MNLLVISSCTGCKRWDPPNALRQEDFRDPSLLRRRTAELHSFSCPAGQMYTGQQHTNVMEGIVTLRSAGVACDLAIVSAGYGLIDEDRPIVPYDVTFHGMSRRAICDWAGFLGIPDAVRSTVRRYPLVIFLLGKDYLIAIDPPIPVAQGQRLIYFAAPGEVRPDVAGTVVVEAGKPQCKQYGAGYVALKGVMFAALARTLAADPDHWLPKIHADSSGDLIRAALGTSRL